MIGKDDIIQFLECFYAESELIQTIKAIIFVRHLAQNIFIN